VPRLSGRIKSLFTTIAMGSFEVPREGREGLLPEATLPGFYESARAYHFAMDIWSREEDFATPPPRSNEELLQRIRAYLGGVDVLGSQRAWAALKPEDRQTLDDLAKFSSRLGERVLGRLNSMQAEAVTQYL